MQGKYSMKTRITSYEVGKTRRLKPSNMLMIMQETAGSHLESGGLSYELMRGQGIVFLLVKEVVRVINSPRCGDKITINTWFERITGPQFQRGMTFCAADGEKLIEAQTYWIIANPNTHRILRPSVFPFDMPNVSISDTLLNAQKIKLPENVENQGSRLVRYSDIDCNNHMNNAIYADLICDYFPGGLGQKEINSFQINYLGEAMLGDEINIKAGEDKNGAVVFEGKIDDRKCFEAIAIAK